MKKDCRECARLKTEIAWGEHTAPPHGYCWVRNLYIWKSTRNCKSFEQIQRYEPLQSSTPNAKKEAGE